MPTMVIAMMMAATAQPAAIHTPPRTIHKTLSRRENGDIAHLASLHATRPHSGDCRARLPAHGRNGSSLSAPGPALVANTCDAPLQTTAETHVRSRVVHRAEVAEMPDPSATETPV